MNHKFPYKICDFFQDTLVLKGKYDKARAHPTSRFSSTNIKKWMEFLEGEFLQQIFAKKQFRKS